MLLGAVAEGDGRRQGVGLVHLVVDADDLGHFVQEVDGDVSAFLEDAGLAHVFQRQTRRREVGHGTVLELDAHVGDVGRGADDADAARTDVAHGRLDDGEQDVEVVHHEVEDHGDVSATRVKHGQAMRLDEQRLADERLCRDEGRVEALHMTHLHLHARLVSELLEGVGLIGSGHDGLLDEDMLAFLQGLGGTFEVTDGRRDDVDNVHRINQVVDRLKTLHVHLGFHQSGRLVGGVIEAHQLILFYLFDAVDMDFAQMPCT